MTKLTVTLGIVDGKPAVLKQPSDNPEEHIAYIAVLTDAGGVVEAAKGKAKAKTASEAYVLHSVFGIMRKRKFQK